MPVDAIDPGDALHAVGPRLRALRQEREWTLARLATETGISLSTLSRIESSRRRPTSPQLLALASAYGVRLDQLVAAPEVADPRVRPRVITRDGMTLMPLSRHAGAIQAFKIVLPGNGSSGPPDPRTHEGFEWLYVLSGRLRLVLADHALTLTAGEVAEFDTRTPHWFASATARPAEVLALFSSQGERLHVRARPATRQRTVSPPPN